MNAWTDFLTQRGAHFDGRTVTSFASPADELNAARDASVGCDLAPLAVLRVAGADALAFLQGQFTGDVGELSDGASQYSAWCSVKGRILANFLLLRNNSADSATFELILPSSLAGAIAKRLAMFVLRSKVSIDNASDDWVHLGIGGPTAKLAVDTLLGGAVPQVQQSAKFDGGSIIALPGGRFIVRSEPRHAPRLMNALAAHAHPAGFPVWQWLTIRAGVGIVTPVTADRFVPQMLNWDALDGVSFRKGCYAGQEIVARTQYLGRLKERLALAHVNAPAPDAGERLYSAGFGDQACGTVVNAAAAPGGGADMLAVLQIAAQESGDVHVGGLDGPAIAFLPLPYALPAAVAPRGRMA